MSGACSCSAGGLAGVFSCAGDLAGVFSTAFSGAGDGAASRGLVEARPKRRSRLHLDRGRVASSSACFVSASSVVRRVRSASLVASFSCSSDTCSCRNWLSSSTLSNSNLSAPASSASSSGSTPGGGPTDLRRFLIFFCFCDGTFSWSTNGDRMLPEMGWSAVVILRWCKAASFCLVEFRRAALRALLFSEHIRDRSRRVVDLYSDLPQNFTRHSLLAIEMLPSTILFRLHLALMPAPLQTQTRPARSS